MSSSGRGNYNEGVLGIDKGCLYNPYLADFDSSFSYSPWRMDDGHLSGAKGKYDWFHHFRLVTKKLTSALEVVPWT